MTTISPNMNLPVPTPSVTPGPDWATDVVADMNAIDSHDHTSGKGVAITPDGLNVNADLPMNDHNLTEVRSVNFEAQASPLALAADLGCLYVSGADLYYNDEAGNQVRITQGGSVAGSAGTITGLPSGTAGASYAAGTFTFQSATSTPANMAVGPVAIGRNVASSKTVTLTPNAAQASNFSLTFPAALPASTSMLAVGSTGSLSAVGTTGTGNVVLDTAPTVTTATVGLADGTLGAPSLSFTSDTDSGLYSSSANVFRAVAGGTDVCSFSVGGLGVTGSVGASAGLSTAGGGVFLVKLITVGTSSSAAGTLAAAHGLIVSSIRGIQIGYNSGGTVFVSGPQANQTGLGYTENLRGSAGATNVTAEFSGLPPFSKTFYAIITYV